ncbi:YkgJ family cysteine cluster protein [Alicyclobacillus sendaiensis]|uniref:YkgJ family cysteine cluster protein n=1 Tax=Alicyclobacillus sendaiensis PA2 TaxID=3029425 RepID=A0ABT6Y243_ALISE|nr:YkgJ family cysteine cluster protein [Alicyclobacillus sendaiensis]MDI9261300.1 YkgJ family cysteine cluster protein [Alicyclobacillus sendaiensis PA2]
MNEEFWDRFRYANAEAALKNFNKFVDEGIILIPDVSEPHLDTIKREVDSYIYLGNIIDILMSSIREQFGLLPSCSKGCAYCCYQAVFITSFEARIIWQWITLQTDSKERIERLKHRLRIWRERIQGSGLTQTVNTYQFKKRYFQARLRCPFLNNDKSCSIYPVRPTPCRTYFSFGNPERCLSNAFVPDTYDGEPWRQIILAMFAFSYESTRYKVPSNVSKLKKEMELLDLLPNAMMKFAFDDSLSSSE